uniref:Secreted protein n=1 Tax=Anguilla anguilla TaxID=7936 RepID=A0A0E9R4A9_ANGAN
MKSASWLFFCFSSLKASSFSCRTRRAPSISSLFFNTASCTGRNLWFSCFSEV